MDTRRKPFYVYKRQAKHGKYSTWYYVLDGEKSGKSTKRTTRDLPRKWQAEAYVTDNILPKVLSRRGTLRGYLEPYFLWDACPHVSRLKSEGKSISAQYAHTQRRRIEMYILTDPIADMEITDIKRGDVLDLRERLLSNNVGKRTVNCTIGALKTVFTEAVYREDLPSSPAAMIGNINYKEESRDPFTREEFEDLFRDCPGYFEDIYDYTAFLLAGYAGLRRSEVLGLRWMQVDFDQKLIAVDHAMTENELPKWDKIRTTVLHKRCAEKLLEIRNRAEWILPNHYVFAYQNNGLPRGSKWWEYHFNDAIERAKINTEGRNLVPHSLRHTVTSILRANGMNDYTLKQIFGWSDTKTLDGYSHDESIDRKKVLKFVENAVK